MVTCGTSFTVEPLELVSITMRHTHTGSDTPIKKMTCPLLYSVTRPFMHTRFTWSTTLDHHFFIGILVLSQNVTNLPGSVVVLNNSFTPFSYRSLEISSFFICQQLFFVIEINQSYNIYLMKKMSGVLILSTASQFKALKTLSNIKHNLM